ncbi:hypothetical protein BC938DRAFT_484234 [Jimgerdemannia flammicorona]|uniref:NodB homology domain-containing protein n=1 Tax=Jimgerdemannia flammicorona TaxID=994334 RepID=A0A433QAF3_9FUNG|nr:hypothetical protein BC938DRAFT_484234 [Jimgerdemannia flammicorona]
MKYLVVLGVLAALATTSSAAPISGCTTTHRVTTGETCNSIAKTWSLSLAQFQSINPSLDCKNLKKGTNVCTKAPSKSTSAGTTCSKKYTIVPNDTCYDIAKKEGITLDTFMSYNPGLNCKLLQIGQQVCIAMKSATGPPPKSTETSPSSPKPSNYGCTKLVVVKSDDTCYLISQAAKITLNALSKMNPGLDCRFLQPGMQVCVAEGPGGKPAPPVPIYTCTQKGQFAITFDDGPYKYTDGLLDYLEQQKLKVTFFINGQNYGNIYDYAKTLQKAYKAGHQIAHHTWSHANISTLNEKQLRAEISQLEVAFRKILGVIPIYFRPPYGEYTSDSLRILGELGYKVIVWDVDTNDWLLDNLAKEQANYKAGVAGSSPKTGGHISLQHDPHQITAEKLAPWAVNYVKGLGYSVTTVAECLGDTNPSNWYRP